MSPELYALLGVVIVALIGYWGVRTTSMVNRRIAELSDRAQLTTSTLAEIQSLRQDSDTREKREATMRAEIDAGRQRTFDCERRCSELERKVGDSERHIRDLTLMVSRWQKHTGLEVPP